jgi:YggT family protein
VTSQAVSIVGGILNFYSFLIIVYVLMTWIPMRGGVLEIHQVIGSIVEPYLGLFRRFIPPLGGMDISPIAAILVLNLLQTLII